MTKFNILIVLLILMCKQGFSRPSESDEQWKNPVIIKGHVIQRQYERDLKLFLNRTKSVMERGICEKEIPTSMLWNEIDDIPVGNGSDPSLTRLKVCCYGYERDPHVFLKCHPVCSGGCENGICVAPDVCICYPKHIKISEGLCIPTCPVGCPNGKCQPDGSCQCKIGFTLKDIPESKFKMCRPEWENGMTTIGIPSVRHRFRGYF